MKTEIVKTRVERELPDETTLRAHGIVVPLEEARVVAAVASRLLVAGRSNGRELLGRAASMIATAVSIGFEDEAGDSVAARLPQPLGSVTPKGPTALKRLGIRASDLNHAWSAGTPFPRSTLTLPVLLQFLPASAWDYLAAFINCGPDEARLRLLHAADKRGETSGTKTLGSRVDETQTFMRCLVELRSEFDGLNTIRARTGKAPLPIPECLAAWTFVPQRPSAAEIKAKAKSTKKNPTSAVPAALVRSYLMRYAREAGWGTRRPEEWPLGHKWSALKRLVLLCLLAAFGLRNAHLTNVAVEDVELEHVFRDGSVGPALVLRGKRGMKDRDDDYEFAVRLPGVFCDILIAWISCNGHVPGYGSAPLIPSTGPRAGQEQRPHASIGNTITGQPPRSDGGGYAYPLIPAPHETWHGFRPHQYRSTLKQELDRLMYAWGRDNPDDPLATYVREVFAECVLDHTRPDLGYLDLRKHDSTPTERFEQIASKAVAVWWDFLWGDGPYRRRGIDPAAIRSAFERLQIGEAELACERERRQHARVEERRLIEAALAARNSDERANLLLQALAARQPQHDGAEREATLLLAVEQARHDLDLARSTEVLLPEHLSESDHAEQLAAVLAEVDALPVPTPEAPEDSHPLADELLTEDLAELYGVTTQHIGRWRRGLSTPPFDHTKFRRFNGKDFRYPAEALDRSALSRVPAPDPEHKLVEIRRGRAAAGFARRRRTPTS